MEESCCAKCGAPVPDGEEFCSTDCRQAWEEDEAYREAGLD